MESQSKDLTGLWHGLYSYGFALHGDHVNFVTTIDQAGETISGTIEEPGALSDFTGSVSGTAVRFTKTYRGAHSVDYRGQLSTDVSEIEGLWRLPGGMTGPFLMVRAPKATVSVEQQVHEKV